MYIGQDSSGSTATCYRWQSGDWLLVGRDFQHPSRLAVRSTQPPIQWVPDQVFPRGKAAGVWRWPPTLI